MKKQITKITMALGLLSVVATGCKNDKDNETDTDQNGMVIQDDSLNTGPDENQQINNSSSGSYNAAGSTGTSNGNNSSVGASGSNGGKNTGGKKNGYSAADGTNAENNDGDMYTRNDTTRMPSGSTSIK